ncbi:hypothetical protein D3C87_2054130 [compost metagenome]
MPSRVKVKVPMSVRPELRVALRSIPSVFTRPRFSFRSRIANGEPSGLRRKRALYFS